MGIRDYFGKDGFQQGHFGSSGGIDSAATLALACTALGKENVRAVLNAPQYSTGHSVMMPTTEHEPRQSVRYHSHQKHLQQFPRRTETCFQRHAVQYRGRIIQSHAPGNPLGKPSANKFGYILLNTSTKANWLQAMNPVQGTWRVVCVLGDCYKLGICAGQVHQPGKEIIPENITTRLRVETGFQKDSGWIIPSLIRSCINTLEKNGPKVT